MFQTGHFIDPKVCTSQYTNSCNINLNLNLNLSLNLNSGHQHFTKKENNYKSLVVSCRLHCIFHVQALVFAEDSSMNVT